ncbi:hypothetical protein D9758_007256 [Tetrapyrgos nigripes]|uniref:Uncharacterized protein n=1 Tax=Tetrapyrgos nigripes TaxID=182062 RepID=A0A8H5D0X4_9AGAR|nr:hypothetical protein D9758_007256 [Tetrapyrgos nigripes]
MTNANLHIYFPYRQLSDANAIGAVYLDCLQDDRPLWIYVRSVGNGQFQRIRANTFYQPSDYDTTHRDVAEEHIREMQFHQPSLNGYTSRLWGTSAKRCIFIVPQSLTSICGYSFLKNDEWHPKHPNQDVLTNPPTLQTSESASSSWCLPFYDAANQKGFVFFGSRRLPNSSHAL